MPQNTTSIESVWAAKGSQPDNAMITTLDTLQGDITGHTVTVGDLSSYTAY